MGELNFLDPDFIEDPYPVYDRLRAEDPVHRHPFGFYALTRYEDVAAFLRDGRFDKHGYQALFESRFGGGPDASWLALSMLFRDPPDHTRLRPSSARRSRRRWSRGSAHTFRSSWTGCWTGWPAPAGWT